MDEATRLRRRLFISQGIILALLCSIVVISVTIPLYKNLKREMERGFSTGAFNKAAAISQWILRAKDLARQVTSRTRIRQELQKYNQGNISLQKLVDFTRPKLNDALLLSEEIIGITRYDVRGNEVVRLGLVPPPTAVKQSTIDPKKVLLGDPFTLKGRNHIWLRAPITDRAGKIVGADVVVVSTEKLEHVLHCSSFSNTDQRTSYNILAYLKGEKYLSVIPDVICGPSTNNPDQTEDIIRIAHHTRNNNKQAQFHFEELFCVAIDIEGTDWVLVTGLDLNKLYASVRRNLTNILIVAVVLYAFCLFGYWKLLTPLAKHILLKHEELESKIMNQTASLKNELDARARAEEALKQSEEKYKAIFENKGTASGTFGDDGIITSCNAKLVGLLGYTKDEIVGKMKWSDFVDEQDLARLQNYNSKRIKEVNNPPPTEYECRIVHKSGKRKYVTVNIGMKADLRIVSLTDITERKQAEEALEKRIIALTRPLGDPEGISFEDLFNLDNIQRLQDRFSHATGVASIITHPDGTPITKPSNFCRLCKDIIRKTEKGLLNCYNSDAIIGRMNPEGPTIQPCFSGGLWDAGAAISIGGKHIANWLIGQVRDETQTDENMRAYAREIGADEEVVVEAFREVPSMSQEQFGQVAQALFTLANQLSTAAYQNIQQARFITDLKQAEEALQESSTLLHTLIQTIPDLIWLKDPDGVYLSCNAKFERFFGAKESDIVGKTDYDFVDKELADFFRNHDKIAMDSGKPCMNEEEVIYADDGHIELLETIKMPMYGSGGNFIGILGIARDITERKRAEEKLLLAKEEWVRTFDAVPDLIAILDNNHKIVRANKAMAGKLGVTPDEAIGLTCYEHVHGTKEPPSYCPHGKLLKDGQIHLTEFYEKRLGGHFLVSVSPLQDNEGNLIGSVQVARDITQQKQADVKLRESETKYRMVVEDTPVLMCRLLPNGKIAFTNKAFCKYFAESPEELTGKSFFSLIPEIDREKVKNNFSSLSADSPTQTYEHRIIAPGGEVGWQKWTNRALFDEHGKVIAYQSLGEDITELKIIEKEKEGLESQLQQARKMEAIGTLAGGIAHDFNNILSPIMIHSQMAMMDLPADSPFQNNVEEIFNAGERAKKLVKQILTFSRKSEGKRSTIKITPIINEAVDMLRASIPTTINIQKKIEVESDTVLADPTQIHQIILNLGTNASHAMREKGGILKVSLAQEELYEESAAQYSDLTPGYYLKLTVSDNGSGMDYETIQKIFDPYFTTKGIGEGTGMGLALVHGIVKSYEGDITVESEPGKGSTFIIYLPRIERDISQIEEPSAQIPKGSERILFVDDEKAVVNAMGPMLENLGYNVTTRTSSVEALETFHHNPDGFDIVITDMTMPNMTGKDLAKELISIRLDIPIILCTGFSDQINEESANEIGIKAFMIKPIVMREMAVTIRKVLD